MEPLVKNPMISKGVADICYAGKNRNRSYISDEVMRGKLAPSVLGVPIVGEYFKEVEDFGDHGGRVVIDSNGIHFEQTTIPYGFVPPNAKISYIDKVDKDGETRKYLRADCYLWTGQYPECARVIETGNPQSMELENDTGYWKRIDGCDHYVIEDAVISKLCILGSDVEPCFEGASFGKEDGENIVYSLNKEDYSNFIKEFALQVKEALEIEQTGGQKMTIEEYAAKVEELEQQIEQFTADLATAQENINTLTADNEALTTFKAENEEKVATLEGEKAELLTFKENAETQIEAMTAELNILREFKVVADNEKKTDLINQFKARNIIDETKLTDLLAGINDLSYEALDAKLCKLYTEAMFAQKTTEPTTTSTVVSYTLNNPINTENSWIEAVQSKQANRK